MKDVDSGGRHRGVSAGCYGWAEAWQALRRVIDIYGMICPCRDLVRKPLLSLESLRQESEPSHGWERTESQGLFSQGAAGPDTGQPGSHPCFLQRGFLSLCQDEPSARELDGALVVSGAGERRLGLLTPQVTAVLGAAIFSPSSPLM